MQYSYTTQGVCARQIDFDVEDGVIKSVQFYGGCDGNLKAISKLLVGMKVEDVIEMFDGHTCGMKSTSCVDQLAQALKQV